MTMEIQHWKQRCATCRLRTKRYGYKIIYIYMLTFYKYIFNINGYIRREKDMSKGWEFRGLEESATAIHTMLAIEPGGNATPFWIQSV